MASYTYHEGNGKLETLTYGNGDKVKYLYDALDRVKEICYNTGENGAFETVYSYEYTASGALAKAHDHRAGETTAFAYDLTGKLIGSYTYETATGTVDFREDLTYDDEDRIVKISQAFPYYFEDYDIEFANTVNHSSVRTFTYNDETGALASTALTSANLSGNTTFAYDDLHRVTNRNASYTIGGTAAMTFGEWYTYIDLEEDYRTSPQIKQVSSTMTVGSTTVSNFHRYLYDDNGNIIAIFDQDSRILYCYTYDDLGQLIREDNYEMGYTYLYTYDAAGNRTGVARGMYTTEDEVYTNFNKTFTYANSPWGDLLTSYGGKTYTYDEIGNPTRISMGSEEYQLVWQGRQLLSYGFAVDMGGGMELEDETTFTYNDEGIRTSKTVNGTVHEYILSGSTVVAEKWKTSTYMEHILVYVYDENGSPVAIQYRHTNYPEGEYDVFFLEKNMFGDVIAIYTETGTKIGTYTYDAWGNFEFSSFTSDDFYDMMLEYYNPFRYRGYYYDVDTGLYYLQSRYYSPEIGRFINADAAEIIAATPEGLTDKNLFAYCDNNPIMRTDEDGEFWLTAIVVGAVIGGVVSFVSSLVTEVVFGDGEINLEDVKEAAVSGLIGIVEGGLTAACPAFAPIISAGAGALDSVVSDLLWEESVQPWQVVNNALISAGFGAITGSWGGDYTKTAKAIDDALDSASDLFSKHASKTARKSARFKFQKAGKRFFKDCGLAIGEGSSMALVEKGTSIFSNGYIERIFG